MSCDSAKKKCDWPRCMSVVGSLEEWRLNLLASDLDWLIGNLTVPPLTQPLPLTLPLRPSQWILFECLSMETGEVSARSGEGDIFVV